MDDRFTLYCGDCRTIMAEIAADSIDSIVTDPPYGLVQNKKGGSGVASINLESPYGRARIGTGNGSGGFMGQKWDGRVPGVEFWQAALRAAKPGAYLLAFGGTRTFHRLACAIEDAGWEMRDCLMWIYGSGFPKSHNGEWGGTALKPAWEPIIMARKELVGTIAENVRKHGTGGLNIDGCRVEFAGAADEREAKTKNQHADFGSGPMTNEVFGKFSKDRENYNPVGRWPANVCHDGSEEVIEEFSKFGEGAAGSRPAKRAVLGSSRTMPSTSTGTRGDRVPMDGGGFGRFFYCAKANRQDRNEGCEHIPKKSLNWSSGDQNPGSFQAERTDRSAHNSHPTVKPADLMRWLVRLVTPAGGVTLDPFMGSGSTGKAAMLEGFRFVGIDLEADYVAIAKARIEHAAQRLPI